VNSELKKDNIRYNNQRIEKTNENNEVWKVVGNISNPQSNSENHTTGRWKCD
jgi:hypothetical protein